MNCSEGRQAHNCMMVFRENPGIVKKLGQNIDKNVQWHPMATYIMDRQLFFDEELEGPVGKPSSERTKAEAS